MKLREIHKMPIWLARVRLILSHLLIGASVEIGKKSILSFATIVLCHLHLLFPFQTLSVKCARTFATLKLLSALPDGTNISRVL